MMQVDAARGAVELDQEGLFMRRHPFARIGSLALSLVLVHGVMWAVGGPATAGPVAVSAAICPLDASALATVGPMDRGCAWPTIARAADTFVARLDCTIAGTEGNDVLVGTGDKDVICGYQGDDVIRGLSGPDIIFGGAGKDRMRGGPGSDRLYGEDGNDRVRGGNGADQVYGQIGNDRLFGDDWNDYLAGGYGNDHFDGGPGSDYAHDSYGNDVAFLGTGRDQFYSDRGIDVVHGGPGSDFCLTTADGQPGDVVDGGLGDEDQFDADATDSWTSVELGPEPCFGC